MQTSTEYLKIRYQLIRSSRRNITARSKYLMANVARRNGELSLVIQAVQSIKLTFNIIFFPSFLTFSSPVNLTTGRLGLPGSPGWGGGGVPLPITTLYNVCAVPWGCSVPWGVFSTVGDIMSTVGDILSTVGGVQYRGGYHEYHGGYLEYCGGVQYRGGYHDTCGGIS